MYKYLISAIAFAFSAGMAFAAPSVSIVSVKQRYPWNGLVDVEITISDAEDSHLYEVHLSVRANGTEVAVPSNSVSLASGDFEWPLKNRAYVLTINLNEMFPKVSAKNARIIASVIDKGELPWPADATGEPVGILADVMTVDVSGGSSAANYPVAYYKNVDTGRFNCDAYKTDKIVLRLFSAGTYVIGYGSSNSRNIPRGNATVAIPYYMGLFPVTQGQYSRVMGDCPAGQNANGELFPVGQIAYDGVRGTTSPTSVPTSGFMSVCNSKITYRGDQLLGWDLPTSVQWEIAARGSELGEYLGGETRPITDYAWYSGNASSVQVVGLKLPSTTGLYDACGNMWEWVRDCNASTFSYNDVETPEVNSSPSRYVRGGAWCESKQHSAISSLLGNGSAAGDAREYFGFRLSLMPSE